ncbi:hypothetical protein BaRGS_00038154 [Batillaria attramentaria]|uniref:Uncharacterized protein n=1 Tax=Batillaria attramentaria TaxID=370345 RepID=A0ABD0J6N9_9CAEN
MYNSKVNLIPLPPARFVYVYCCKRIQDYVRYSALDNTWGLPNAGLQERGLEAVDCGVQTPTGSAFTVREDALKSLGRLVESSKQKTQLTLPAVSSDDGGHFRFIGATYTENMAQGATKAPVIFV